MDVPSSPPRGKALIWFLAAGVLLALVACVLLLRRDRAPAKPATRAARTDARVAIAKLSPEQKQKAYDGQVNALQERLSALQAHLDSFPKALYDLDELAPSLTTPQAAFEYVRDHVALEPYPGIMKGAQGTLVTRGGNPLDRALLLAALLKQQGLTPTIAHGKLSPERAQALLQRAGSGLSAVELMARSLAGVRASSLTPAQRLLAQEQAGRGEGHGKALRATVDQGTELLAKSVPEGERKAPALESDHYWVQATLDDKAVDLDPSLPGAKMGEAPATAADTFDPDSPPDGVFQVLRLDLVAEFLAKGQVARKELVSKTARATDVWGKNIRLAIGPESLEREANRYTATLGLGDDEQSALLEIRPTEAAPGGGESGEAEVGGAVGGLFGGLGGEEPVKKEAPVAKAAKGTPTGEVLARLSLEVTSRGAGLPEAMYRRVIIDRVEGTPGAFRLQAGMEDDRTVRALLVQVWDGTAVVGSPHLLRIFQAKMEALAALEPLEEKARGSLYLDQELGQDDLPGAQLPPELLSYTLASDLGTLALAGKGGPRRYYERPRVLFLRHGFSIADWSKPGAGARFREGIDLINSPFGFVGGAGRSRRLALATGVLDTALERSVVRARADFNTLPLFSAAAEQGIATMVAAGKGSVESLAVPVPIKQVLADEVGQGRTLLLPSKLVELNGAPTFGWWSVDASGIAVGRMELGGSQDMVEIPKLESDVSKIAKIFGKFYGGILGCFGLAIADALGPPTGPYSLIDSEAIPYGAGDDMPQLKGGGPLPECVVGVACEAIKDITDEIMSEFELAEGYVDILKDLRELIAEWAFTERGKPELAEACKENLGD